MEANRVEVLQLYRELMKKTSRALPRRFVREAKLAEFRYFVRLSADETDPDQINEIKLVLWQIVHRLDNGIYPPFPTDRIV